MFRSLASRCNEQGNEAKGVTAFLFYRAATLLAPTWSDPWYNLGFRAKYSRQWKHSLTYNKRAASLSPTDEATLWNLAIAATALHQWEVAANAWTQLGVATVLEDGELRIPERTDCVRLQPNEKSEVVWGTRRDPVRMMVDNVPLPESQRRYHDIILHDGAANGSRTHQDNEYVVFDEIEVWRQSDYSTFEATLFIASDAESEVLHALCNHHEVGFEDWSSIRILCTQCSLGNPDKHACAIEERGQTGERRYGFAATSQKALMDVLNEWHEECPAAVLSDLRLVFSA